jgi:hypothetical protein
MIAASIRSTLDVMVEVIVVPPDQALAGARALMEKKLHLPWDVLVHAWFDLSSEAPPAAVHREFFGLDGAFRAGPPDDGFDALFDEMKVQLDGAALVEVAERIDAYVQDQALALFICAPRPCTRSTSTSPSPRTGRPSSSPRSPSATGTGRSPAMGPFPAPGRSRHGPSRVSPARPATPADPAGPRGARGPGGPARTASGVALSYARRR